jgi:oligopeptide transport system ATP-binding protein
MSDRPILEVRELKKYFPLSRKTVLKAVDGVSFGIARGRTLGLVGESGCGKTTVGRTVLRLYDADGGQVLFDGIDVQRASKAEYKQLTRRMQIIFQDPYASLNPRFMVREIVGEGLEVHRMYASRAERNERIDALLDMVGLCKEHAGRFPHEFSGGQRQRVGIARALAVNPEFIVCDEAISALDMSIQAQIINLLVKLQEDLGLAYLFIAHNLSVVRHISDDTAVMYMGCLVEMGSSKEIYAKPVHPYTRGLLSAVLTTDPEYEQAREHRLLKGEVTSPTGDKAGCRFCPRCELATPQCTAETPLLRDVGGRHWAACHNI